MRVAIISDALTMACLMPELKMTPLGPFLGKAQLNLGSYDFLLVESSWEGNFGKWKYRIASYPAGQDKSIDALKRVVFAAKERGIPTVFWNKEDSVHYARFVESAKLFDYVFTVDSTCISRYRADLPKTTHVESLMFPVQPLFHSFSGFNFRYSRANFVGSYSRHIHSRRQKWQDMIFGAADGMGVSIYDRNSARKSTNYRFPKLPNLEIHSAIGHRATAEIYKRYLVSLNVNTVEDSPTMYSRRLVEILACGGIAVTSPAISVSRYFSDFCHVISTPLEAQEIFRRLQHGPNPDDLERARAGAEYVLREHTWKIRLNQIAKTLGL